MGQSVVLPAKHKSEIHQFVADFNTLLTTGDSIIAGTLTVAVTLDTGTDPSPQAILVPSPTIIGNVVSQGLQQGVVGCIYTIVIQVNTTLGNVVNMNARLAILEDNYPPGGAFIYYYFTSQPYPITFGDVNHWGASVSSAMVFEAIYNYSLSDTNSWGASVRMATINDGTYTQVQGDTNHWAAQIVSAMVFDGVANYTLPETNHWMGAVVSAAVTTIVINYTDAETNHWAASVQSATVM